jgi:hypothetical protein
LWISDDEALIKGRQGLAIVPWRGARGFDPQEMVLPGDSSAPVVDKDGILLVLATQLSSAGENRSRLRRWRNQVPPTWRLDSRRRASAAHGDSTRDRDLYARGIGGVGPIRNMRVSPSWGRNQSPVPGKRNARM